MKHGGYEMIKKWILFLLFVALNPIILSGCWDLREINEIGLVTAVGIDKGSGPNRYAVTVQVANPTSAEASGGGSSGGGSGSSGKSEVWIGTEEGSSLFDAQRKLAAVSSRRIMWAHNNVVIIGESLAREGIIPVIDFFSHNPELRMKSTVAIANGDAKEYIAAKAGMESPSGVSFILLESYRSILAESVESHLLHVSAALKNIYANPLIAEIRMKSLVNQSVERSSGGKNPETIGLSGSAVFKRDKMLGWLSPVETRGIAWILNETKNTVVTVTEPLYEDKNVAVETRHVKAKFKTRIVNGMPKISISVSGEGDIVEEDGVTKASLSDVKTSVSGLVSKKIEEEIRNSLEVIQKKYMVDVISLSAIVHSQNNKEWNFSVSEWEEIFPRIPVSVSVKISITTSTLNQEPRLNHPDNSMK